MTGESTIYRGDLHVHTCFSRDCDVPPEKLVRRCLAVGLNCIAVTDHNTIRGALEVRALAPFTVIVGEEVRTTEGEIVGLFLQEEIPRGLSPLETVQRIKGQGGLVLIPHPFDTLRRGPLSPAALREVLPLADLVEAFNARTICNRDLWRCQRLAEETALPALAVSDAHTLGELGRAYTEFAEFDGSALSLKDAVSRGSMVGRRAPLLVHAVTSWVKIKKRLLGTDRGSP